MNNYKITFSYDGTFFSGFQIQPDKRTVESALRSALRSLFNCDIKIISSGRTDSGVHAEGHVINVVTKRGYSVDAIKNALNNYLPRDIFIKNVCSVSEAFHARFDAMSREYRYLFSSANIPFYLQNYVASINFNPSMEMFFSISESVVGKKDFINFRNVGSNEESTIREIYKFDIREKQCSQLYFGLRKIKIYEVRVVGSSFLYRMVRNLVGAIFEVLKNKQTINEFRDLFIDSNKKYLYTTAPAKGLSLVRVKY